MADETKVAEGVSLTDSNSSGKVGSTEEPSAFTPSPEDMAAHDYKLLMPKFWKIVEPMSRRQEQRVFKALMEYPLEGGIPRFSYENEREAFYLGLQIFDCKFVLMRAVMELTANKDKLDKFKADLEALNKTEGVVNDSVSSGLSGEASGGGSPS
jgi:hypothetical protein